MTTGQRRLGKYELQKRLAHGGMGEVWRAHDTQLDRYIAIKLLRTDVQDNPEFATRFEQEARFIAALRHPNIVQIHDFSISHPPESDIPTAYIVMDYIEGQTLGDYIRSTSRKSKFPPAADIVYIFTAISSALDYAHREGKIHRDIKPANILLDQRLSTARAMGEPILIDFGIARLQGVATGTVVGSLLGTPLYISPEQAEGRHGDHRSDLYSLGIILYEMMTGTPPFHGETTMAILMQHLQDMPTAPELINPTISPELSAVILKSIAKKMDDRYPTASAMTIALAEVLHVPVPAKLRPPSSSPSWPSSPSQSRPLSSPGLTPAFYGPAPHASTPVHDPTQSPTKTFQNNPVTPPDLLAQGISPAIPATHPGQNYYAAAAPTQPSPVAPRPPGQFTAPQQPGNPNKKRLFLLILAVLAVLIIVGAGFETISSTQQQVPPTPGTSVPVTVGQLQFSHSPQATNGAYDQLSITLHNVPAPPSGRIYYAWIDTLNYEGTPPHWLLTVQNGSIQQTVTYNHKNLLIPNALFVITAESSTITPVVAYTMPDQRFFYARITSTSTQTFNVQSCPRDPSSQVCMG
jgi:eukaryotic-like serine/threonine-protein kinase